MPYVQRDLKGKIVGVYANPQPGRAEEFLAEDHPEIIEFREANPVPEEMLKPLSEKDLIRLEQVRKRVEKEHTELRNAIWAFNRWFSELEIALSALLYEAMHAEPRSSKIAYAAYYSPDGFHGRIVLVDNVIKQLIFENDALSDLAEQWNLLFKNFSGVQKMRNSLAHGTPITLAIRGRNHVRLTAPAFDVIRVGRPLASTGDPPGLKADDIRNGVLKLRWLAGRVDDVNRVIDAFHQNEPIAFSERLLVLKSGLQTSHNP